TGDDVGVAIAVDVPGRDAHAADEAWEGEEAHQQAAIPAAEDLDVTAWCPGISADDEVSEAVTINVARGHEDAARVARQAEAAHHEGGGPAVEDLNVPARDARPARDDGVEDTVTVDVTDRHADIALEARRKSANRSGGEETSQNVRGPEGLQHRRGSRDCDRSILADNDLDRRRRGQTFDTRERELLSGGGAGERSL